MYTEFDVEPFELLPPAKSEQPTNVHDVKTVKVNKKNNLLSFSDIMKNSFRAYAQYKIIFISIISLLKKFVNI